MTICACWLRCWHPASMITRAVPTPATRRGVGGPVIGGVLIGARSDALPGFAVVATQPQ
jgi:hypothetical protein